MTTVLHPAVPADLLNGSRWRRVAVLGDSIAEGVREPADGYRNLSWVDRIVEPLHLVDPSTTVLNLGRRSLVAREVRETQLRAALAFAPDLAIVAAGGNDALADAFDAQAVAADLDAIVGPLRSAGADVLMIELMDIVKSGLVADERRDAVDARMRALATVTRDVARGHGALLVEMRAHPACADPTVYASDRLHLNARGHAIVGAEAVRVLAGAVTARLAQQAA